MAKIIAVDVDGTVVDSVEHWLKWFEEKTGVARPVFKDYNYMLDDILNQKAKESKHLLDSWVGFDSYQFWKGHDIYDNMVPIEDCVETLEKIKKVFRHKIIFVSVCSPEHEASKIRFLKKHFPFADGFISTKNKDYVRYDYLIDDAPSNIISCAKANPDSSHIIYTGSAERVMGVVPPVAEILGSNPNSCYAKTWKQVGNIICPNLHLAVYE